MSLFSPKSHFHHPARALQLDAQVAVLNARFRHHSAIDVLHYSATEMGRVAVVSSFGAEAAVLLHMVSLVDRDMPVWMIDTQMLFPETLAYQTELAAHLGLTGVLRLTNGANGAADRDSTLHQRDTDACCALRKTQPLQTALKGMDAWVTGRKRFQSGTRAHLEFFEAERGTDRIKVNPLVQWSAQDLRTYMVENDLPRHPLVARGYPSIGCAPCTSPVAEGADARSGRWANSDKDECGIHFVNGKLVRQGAST